jgi:hypothetical protein
MRARVPSLTLLLLTVACGSPPSIDGGTDASSACVVDDDCAGAFCDGERRCVGTSSGARECVVVRSACDSASICDEAMRRCIRTCDLGDADGDGVDAVECGGSDCDDGDADRYPGNAEVCDVDHRDEDCDPTTFGVRDADGDSYPDAACCNTAAGGAVRCGTDCDDTRSTISPAAPDTCNGVDEDCDGIVDEDGTSGAHFPDCDGDGYGAAGSTSIDGCLPSGPPAECGGTATAGWSTNATDCDDTRASVLPTAAEVCDGLDNDCDPSTFAVDEDDDGDGYADVACGGTDCDDECATCHPGGGLELCDGLDQDCNGAVDEGVDPALFTTSYRDGDGDGVGDTSMPFAACLVPPSHTTVAGDCNDASSYVGACSAPLGCVSGTVCGCRAAVFNNSHWLDLDRGTVSLVSSPAAGRDVIVNNRTFGRMHLQVNGTSTYYRRYDPADFLAVDATYAAGVSSTGEDPLEWTPSTVYVVHTSSGGYYKLGLFERPGTGVAFVYAPLGAVVSGFVCM